MFDLLLDDLFVDALQRQTESDVVEYGHLRVQRVALEYHRDLPLAGAHLIGSFPVDQEIAVGDVLKSGDHAERRGLSAAGRSDKYNELSLLNLKVEIVDGMISVGIDLIDVLQR